jgi:hypothetical protein
MLDGEGRRCCERCDQPAIERQVAADVAARLYWQTVRERDGARMALDRVMLLCDRYESSGQVDDARIAAAFRVALEHDCSTCPDCLHAGAKCCGCYDGWCCRAEGSR